MAVGARLRLPPGRSARCGTSGGDVTWGVKEPADISEWAVWLRDRTHAGAIFGCGASRGSTNLLQSLALKAPFTSLALEATGAGNISQPYKFISDKMGISERTARMTWWPVIEPSFWWIRLRYGFDMRNALDGVTAIRGSQVAVLLIHGSEDRGAALSGAERIRDANQQHAELVVIRGANHEWFSEYRPEVIKREVQWFDAHAKS
jgi:pimeloyl-ACP methyl ester carboxylesterase